MISTNLQRGTFADHPAIAHQYTTYAGIGCRPTGGGFGQAQCLLHEYMVLRRKQRHQQAFQRNE
jgi:hypothetical protein